jgi:succinoglycan biosynthesis transport protein ExoP
MVNIDLRFYARLLLRRLPLFIAIVVFVSACGVTAAWLLPSRYLASAKVLAEAPQIPTELARSTVPTSSVEQLQIIEQEITTRSNLLSLARTLNIYAGRSDVMTDADIVEDVRKHVRFEQVRLDSPEGRPSSATLFTVSFDADNADLAANVVNTLVKSILERNVSLRITSATDTQQFFQQEVTRLGLLLSELDRKILTFKDQNINALPDSIEFRRTQQSADLDRLMLLDREEASLRSRRNSLIQLHQISGQSRTGTATPEQQMLADLKRTLSEQLAVFSADGPTIIALKARIEAMQATLKSAPRGPEGSSTATQPLSELDMQLADIDNQLQFIAADKAAASTRLNEIAKSIAATPANETALNGMERDRLNIQAQYNATVAKMAEASIGEQVEFRSKGGRFSIVEPAVAPPKPTSPNRRRIVAGAVLVGLALAFAVIVGLELLNKTIRRPSEIVDLFGIQPLVSIPHIAATNESRRQLPALAAAVVPGRASLVWQRTRGSTHEHHG